MLFSNMLNNIINNYFALSLWECLKIISKHKF